MTEVRFRRGVAQAEDLGRLGEAEALPDVQHQDEALARRKALDKRAKTTGFLLKDELLVAGEPGTSARSATGARGVGQRLTMRAVPGLPAEAIDGDATEDAVDPCAEGGFGPEVPNAAVRAEEGLGDGLLGGVGLLKEAPRRAEKPGHDSDRETLEGVAIPGASASDEIVRAGFGAGGRDATEGLHADRPERMDLGGRKRPRRVWWFDARGRPHVQTYPHLPMP